ncbi:hypothetical protein QCB44_10060 [Thiomicrorhabdus sp. zzn3]|uniref:hypothetical protein n=1 Tax=Thiomicrorhabdus sp. zzn3 TaxID=3039775 RepID=UPI002436F910|nr:hypothetical protein [Thiomicrorhabdus sp. zzn3]MDG6779048.1 hypothetical protein [Thiomicrorhabdus sp. zzn3]
MNRKFNQKREKGAVLLETAYVLPVMIGVILFLIEATSYALNSFAANDVLTDVHAAIVSEVEAVSNKEPGQTVSPTPVYVFCDTDKVVMLPDSDAILQAHAKEAMEAKGITFVGQPTATISSNIVGGFDVYVINFTGTATPLVLPDMFEQGLPMDVDTIVSIKDSCTP